MSGKKLLVIGAGRIAAEVLNAVAVCGFDDIEIIDMESDDVMNLGKQFEETVCSIGKSRAEVTRESLLVKHPNIQLKVTNCGYSFFQRFDLVLNALDNRLDRDQINAMCIKANVPTIDCYACAKFIDPYPTDTVQNPCDGTHQCVAWSIFVVRQLLGQDAIDNVQKVNRGSKVLKSLAMSKDPSEKANLTDINIYELAELNNYNTPPILGALFDDDINDFSNVLESPETGNLTGIDREYKVWSKNECQSIFATSFSELREELAKQDEMDVTQVENTIVDFVTATTNLRATFIDIPRKSRLEIKLILILVWPNPDLLYMATEMVDCIFDNFDDETLLAASRTCKRFQHIARRIFERKYSNQPYKVEYMEDIENQKMHRSILIDFGEKFERIEIIDTDMIVEHRWLLDVLKKHATTLKELKLSTDYVKREMNLSEVLSSFPKLTHLDLDGFMFEEDNWSNIHMPHLIHVGIFSMDIPEEEHFVRFFTNNRQIESLTFKDTETDLMDNHLNGLNQLKRLQVPEYMLNQTSINLESLEKLHLTDITEQFVLEAFTDGCKNIKELLLEFHIKFDEQYVSIISSFELLGSLSVDVGEITIDNIKLIERQLPNLKSFTVITEMDAKNDRQLLIDNILSMISDTMVLTQLELKIDMKCPECFDASFHERFLKAIGANRPDFTLLLKLGGRHHSTNVEVTKNQITCD